MSISELPLDADSLRCFVAGAEHLSFRVAAGKVALSPAAFSDRIKRLEDDLDAQLFVRTTRSVKLTEAGERLLPAARRALEAHLDCRKAVLGSGPVPYELVVGTRFELGLSWLVPALDELRTLEPHRTVHLRFGDSPELLEHTERGTLDATVSSVRLSSTRLEYSLLHEERYAFVGHRSLLEKHPIRGPADVAHHTLLDAHRDLPLFRYFLDGSPPDETWAFGRTELLGTIAAIRSRILARTGVGVLPRYLIEADLERGRLKAILPARKLPTDYFRLIWRAGHPRAEALRRLADHLRGMPLR